MSIFRKKTQVIEYDKASKIPILKVSICTGEKVAGFKDVHTGRFEDIMLIRTDSDMKKFREMYGITEEIGTMY